MFDMHAEPSAQAFGEYHVHLLLPAACVFDCCRIIVAEQHCEFGRGGQVCVAASLTVLVPLFFCTFATFRSVSFQGGGGECVSEQGRASAQMFRVTSQKIKWNNSEIFHLWSSDYPALFLSMHCCRDISAWGIQLVLVLASMAGTVQ